MAKRFYAVNFVTKNENKTNPGDIDYLRGILPAKLLEESSPRIHTECLPEGDERFDINVYKTTDINAQSVETIKSLASCGCCVALDTVSTYPSVFTGDVTDSVGLYLSSDLSNGRDDSRDHFVRFSTSFGKVPPKRTRGYREGKVNLLWFGDDFEKRSYKHIKKNQVDHHKNSLYICTKNSYTTKYSTRWTKETTPMDVIRDKAIDVILFPKGTSPFRVLDGILSGVFCVMDEREPAFEAFKDYGYFGNLNDGIEFFRYNPTSVYSRIRKGQSWIEKEYTELNVYSDWKRALLLE